MIRRARAEQAAAIRSAFAGLIRGFAVALLRTGRVITRMIRTYVRQNREQQAASELDVLSEYELKDLGVTRCEIATRIRLSQHKSSVAAGLQSFSRKQKDNHVT